MFARQHLPRFDWRPAEFPSEGMLWGVAMFFAFADVALTVYGLENGAVEKNPVMRAALGAYGYAVIPVIKLAIIVPLYGVVRACPLPFRVRYVIPLGLTPPWLLAVAINVLVVSAPMLPFDLTAVLGVIV